MFPARHMSVVVATLRGGRVVQRDTGEGEEGAKAVMKRLSAIGMQ